MSEVLKANKREVSGTGASRRLRRAGEVPTILYGDTIKPLPLTVSQKDVFIALKKEEFHTNTVILEVGTKKYTVILRDYQMHPYKPEVQHLDFQLISPEKPVRLRVPLRFVNAEISDAVKLHGRTILKILNSVEVYASPKHIPSHLTIDLKDIKLGQILHLSDIELPNGVRIPALQRGQNLPIASASGKSR